MTRKLLIAALFLAAAPMTALADQPGQGPGGDATVHAPPQGQVPLSRVLRMLGQQHQGKQLNTTMEQVGGRPAYRVQWLLTNGRIVFFTVDAQTGQVVAQQGG